MRIIIIILSFLLLIFACNPVKKQKERISQVEEKYGAEGYETAFSCMSYLMDDPDDPEFAFELIDKLINTNHFIEARYALENLGKKIQDYRIHYLTAVCYRNEFQFTRAMKSIEKAMELSDAKIVENEVQNIVQDSRIWNNILELDEKIENDGSDSSLLLSRAEKLVSLNYREAAFYDIDRLLENSSYINLCYKLKIKAELQRNEFGVADSIAGNWNRIATGASKTESGEILTLLNLLTETQHSVNSGNNSVGNFITMGKTLVQLESYSQAEKWILKGIQKYPDDPRLKMALILVYLQSGDIPKARTLAGELKKEGMNLPAEIEGLVE